ncbi:hypothetical protein WAI453_010880 [Rhynchosporium graminicola]
MTSTVSFLSRPVRTNSTYKLASKALGNLCLAEPPKIPFPAYGNNKWTTFPNTAWRRVQDIGYHIYHISPACTIPSRALSALQRTLIWIDRQVNESKRVPSS